MSAPSLFVQINGQNQVSADQFNTFFQTCNIVTDLRAFIGAPGVQVYLRGFTSPADGGQGTFYWNATGTHPDDGGVTTIAPNGAGSGVWTRLSNDGTAGTPYVFSAGTVTGTPNALIVSNTFPVNYSLQTGVFITLFPIAVNTGPVTINIVSTGAIAIKKVSPSGFVDLAIGDLAPGLPLILLYNGSVYIDVTTIYVGTTQVVSTNQNIAFASLFNSYVATAAVTFTVSRTATTLSPYWFINFDAQGGAITITPDSNDTIKVSGVTLATSASYVVPQGASGTLYTDSNGNLYINYINIPPAQSTSGGFINKFRNPGMDISSRGTSSTVTTGNANYALDGWIVGATGATVSWAQGGANTASSGQVYSASLQLTGNTSMTATFVKQRIEAQFSQSLTGPQITVQASITNTTGSTLVPTLTVRTPTIINNWGATATVVNGVNLQSISSGGSGIVSYTFAASNASLGLEVQFDFGAALNANTKSLTITGCDIRSTPNVNTGLNSSPPPIVDIPPLTSIIEMCQRYLPTVGAVIGPVGTGAATSTSASGYFIPFAVKTYIATTNLTGVAANFEIATFAGVDVAACTGLSFSKGGQEGAFISVSVSGTPLTSGVSYFLYAKTAGIGNLIFLGSEL